MPRAPRLRLSPDFRKAVLADPRGVVRLCHLIGLSNYTSISRLLHKSRISGTALNQERLRQLAAAINFDGPVFREVRR